MWSVKELNSYVRDLFESDELLQDLWVEGEISNLSRPSSGHMYFTLKDESAALRCVMWRNDVYRLKFTPRDGMLVQAHGSLSVYEVSGQYQLYAAELRPAGEGALYQEFLRLKERLEAEGLFDPARKRPLPPFPAVIGVVTSPTGAALRDILNTLSRRYPLAEVVISPTPVQGIEAPPAIVQALDKLNRIVHPDVILLARGGGSIEDLWAFNDELVARAIAASSAPVITGVGHETDFTIADFTSDLRAPTPTAAAELATPNRSDLVAELADIERRLDELILSRLFQNRQAFEAAQSRLAMRSPERTLQTYRQRLDELLHLMDVSASHMLELKRASFTSLEKRIAALNPDSVLKRGYALVRRSSGGLLASAAQVSFGDELSIQMHDGEFSVVVSDGKEGAA
ncbi:MAG: exodeoxyribonuclease VII large subunit [Anaerolineae bacterium UTCFX2]|jgi:exodeoxyribonuclease VII large subunit|nr:MAG: exodeoxyribonuclease VII large subunit [Anaerolineae bacterium UTCFX2]